MSLPPPVPKTKKDFSKHLLPGALPTVIDSHTKRMEDMRGKVPDVPEAPSPPDGKASTKDDMQKSRQDKRRRLAARQGRSASILSSPRGDTTAAEIKRPTLG